jgi:hypothetical protein
MCGNDKEPYQATDEVGDVQGKEGAVDEEKDELTFIAAATKFGAYLSRTPGIVYTSLGPAILAAYAALCPHASIRVAPELIPLRENPLLFLKAISSVTGITATLHFTDERSNISILGSIEGPEIAVFSGRRGAMFAPLYPGIQAAACAAAGGTVSPACRAVAGVALTERRRRSCEEIGLQVWHMSQCVIHLAFLTVLCIY